MEGRSTVTLSIADNGIIKEITDYQVNGTAGTDEYLIVYEYDDDPESNKSKTVELLNDLVEDLNLEIESSAVINIVKPSYVDGSSFIESESEAFINSKIKELKEELKHYQKLLKEKGSN